MINYGFRKELPSSFEEAGKKIRDALKAEGFGILTEIDVREKFREKLGLDFRKYVILGACSPANAHKAILAEEDIGLMLPCNVVIREKKDGGVVLSVIKPTVAMGMVENEELAGIARGIEEKLKRAFDSVS